MVNNIKCFSRSTKIPQEYFLLSPLQCTSNAHKSTIAYAGYYVYYESPTASHKGYHSCVQTLSVYDMKVSQINDYKLIAKKLADSVQITYHLHPYALKLF